MSGCIRSKKSQLFEIGRQNPKEIHRHRLCQNYHPKHLSTMKKIAKITRNLYKSTYTGWTKSPLVPQYIIKTRTFLAGILHKSAYLDH